MAQFRMKAFDGGARDDQRTAGWIALVDDNGVKLWAGWVSPVPDEVWSELVRAASGTGYDRAISALLDVARRTDSPAAWWAADYLTADPDRQAPAGTAMALPRPALTDGHQRRQGLGPTGATR